MDKPESTTLTDEDIRTIMPQTATPAARTGDPDGKDADGTDGDAKDGTDGDSTEQG